MDNKQDYVVTGVLKDLPENSSLQFEWLAPFQAWYNENKDWAQEWNNFGITTYVPALGDEVTLTIEAEANINS